MIGNRCLNERVACVLCYSKLMSICKKNGGFDDIFCRTILVGLKWWGNY